MEKKKIMIVEDEGIIALDIKKRLEELGYSVPIVVDSGEEAIEQASKMKLDLILMDIVLNGEITGVDAAIKIWRFLSIPIIYITSFFNEDCLIKNSHFKYNYDYIIKPFSQTDLQLKIEHALVH